MIGRVISTVMSHGLAKSCAVPGPVFHLGFAFPQRAFCQSSSLTFSLSSTIEREFERDPKQAAASIAALPQGLRAQMLRAITEDEAAPGSVKFISSLMKQADLNNDGSLQLSEFETALKAHAMHGKHAAADAQAPPALPTQEQLLRVFTASAIPFIGFGFLDNLIMILAGDYIDASLGSAFCLSTMAAAGFGNLISDIAGIFCADSIESRARVFKYGRMPKFSAAQREASPIIYVKSAGAVVGISLGCILGMFPLLFSSHRHSVACADECDAADGTAAVIADA